MGDGEREDGCFLLSGRAPLYTMWRLCPDQSAPISRDQCDSIFYPSHCAQMAKARVATIKIKAPVRARAPSTSMQAVGDAPNDGCFFDIGTVCWIVLLGAAVAFMLTAVSWGARQDRPVPVEWERVSAGTQTDLEYDNHSPILTDADLDAVSAVHAINPDPAVAPVYNVAAVVPVGLEHGLLNAHPLDDQPVSDTTYAPAP